MEGTGTRGRRTPGFRGFLVLLAAVCLFRAWYATTLPLAGDEAYHWEWSRNLAAGYYDHPGLNAWLIRASTAALGRSTELTVRLPSILSLGGAAVLCFLLAAAAARRRGLAEGDALRAGWYAGCLVLAMPIDAGLALYAGTDPPLVLCWSLALLLLHRAFVTGRWGSWIGAGVAVGLAMLCKFLAFFLGPAVLAYVLLSREDRVWLRRPHPYVGAACALAVFAPFLVWNATHGWATFGFNFVARQKPGGLDLVHLPEFVATQALALSPGMLLFLAWGLVAAARDGWRRADRSALFLACSSGVPLLYFVWMSLRKEVDPQWLSSMWSGAVAYLGVAWAAAEPGWARWRRVVSWGLCLALTVALHLALHVPPRWVRAGWVYSKSPERVNAAQNVERFGWRDLGGRVQAACEELLRDQGSTPRGVFVIAGQYGLCANVAFYTPGQPRTHLWARQRTHGENYRFWDDFPALKGQDAVFVAKEERRALEDSVKLAEHFERIGSPERVPVTVGGQEIRAFYLVRCREFDGRAPEFPRRNGVRP